MNADAQPSRVEDINRLHTVVLRCNADSRAALNAALTAAWHAGRLLVAERERVNATMRRGAWCGWLRKNFRGSVRTAHRYVRLAQSISDVTFLGGLSLRQAYFRLGIATEPKKHGQHPVTALPAYVRLATRLVCALRRRPPRGPAAEAVVAAYRRDLRSLYEQLQPLFADANQGQPQVSKGP